MQIKWFLMTDLAISYNIKERKICENKKEKKKQKWITLKLTPKAMKLGDSTLKVAEATLLEELSDHTMADLPLPFPLKNMYGLFFGM